MMLALTQVQLQQNQGLRTDPLKSWAKGAFLSSFSYVCCHSNSKAGFSDLTRWPPYSHGTILQVFSGSGKMNTIVAGGADAGGKPNRELPLSASSSKRSDVLWVFFWLYEQIEDQIQEEYNLKTKVLFFLATSTIPNLPPFVDYVQFKVGDLKNLWIDRLQSYKQQPLPFRITWCGRAQRLAREALSVTFCIVQLHQLLDLTDTLHSFLVVTSTEFSNYHLLQQIMN